ncbi:MAG TPA: hypothetical protein VND62_10755 [Acidimicrobiales bacterium]|nr:hypothetical protein [Acidimicrobiales bacterium]
MTRAADVHEAAGLPGLIGRAIDARIDARLDAVAAWLGAEVARHVELLRSADRAIPPNVRATLVQHLATYVGPSADAPLLVGERDDPLAPSLLRKARVSARTEVGRPDLHLPDLRHTGATFAAATGASTKELMARLGPLLTRGSPALQHATADRDEALANVRPLR